jgi:hypothetical protein
MPGVFLKKNLDRYQGWDERETVNFKKFLSDARNSLIHITQPIFFFLSHKCLAHRVWFVFVV